MLRGLFVACLVLVLGFTPPLVAQDPGDGDAAEIGRQLDELNLFVADLKRGRDDVRPVADIEVFAKAAEWIVRHHEFYEPGYAAWTIEALESGLQRAHELTGGRMPWRTRAGSSIAGYYSNVDGSVQPYVVTLPRGYDPKSSHRWPLHVELHGRGDTLNEVRFIHQHEGRPLKEELAWIQLDVFGRTNNAYRWAGETDVFEAMASLKQNFRIDDRRITLRGFSMGGAGVWQIGLHHPSLWSSIGAGAGFVDTVHHLGLKLPLSPLAQKLTKIYDAQDYALNAFDVPVIGYGGELDAQVFAAKTMFAKGQELEVPIRLLIGPETAHKWHPDRFKEFMAFHAEQTARGRPPYPNPPSIKFITYTLKYNRCDWLTIEEQVIPYEPTVVEADVEAATGTLRVHTKNVSLLQIMRDVAEVVVLDDGPPLALNSAAGNLLPGVYYEKRSEGWAVWDYRQSHKYAAHEAPDDGPRKRHDLQGPIDDAFMQPFVCVKPTGSAWSSEQNEWAKWTLDRFEREFDRRLRGRVPVINDTQVTDELIETRHLVLFGDPGSNAVLAKIVDKLPLKWNRQTFEVADRTYNPVEHGLAMIYPNPLNPRKYVVINSGHTFHEPEFRASNANLYPRLGDVGVVKFFAQPDGGHAETILFADVFDARWQFELK
jgi:dienelactone hydrolase